MKCPHCGKVCYETRSEAIAAFAPMAKRFPKSQKVKAYKCYSGYWHYGHLSAWNGRRRNQGAW